MLEFDGLPLEDAPFDFKTRLAEATCLAAAPRDRYNCAVSLGVRTALPGKHGVTSVEKVETLNSLVYVHVVIKGRHRSLRFGMTGETQKRIAWFDHPRGGGMFLPGTLIELLQPGSPRARGCGQKKLGARKGEKCGTNKRRTPAAAKAAKAARRASYR